MEYVGSWDAELKRNEKACENTRSGVDFSQYCDEGPEDDSE